MTAERPLKLRNIRHHEAKFGTGIGELALQIQKVRARNMPGLERVTPGYGEIGQAAAFRRGFEIGGAVEQAHISLAQNFSEFRRGDEPVTPRHLQASRYFRPMLGPASGHEKAAGTCARPFNSAIPVQYSG
jgi:hypothetical protein